MNLSYYPRELNQEVLISDIVKIKNEIMKGIHISRSIGYELGMKSFQHLLIQMNASISGLLNGTYELEYFKDEKHRIYVLLTEFLNRRNIDVVIDVDMFESKNIPQITNTYQKPIIASNDEFYDKFQDVTFLHAHRKVYQQTSDVGLSNLKSDMKSTVAALLEKRKQNIDTIIRSENREVQKAVKKIYSHGNIGELRSDFHISEAANDAFFTNKIPESVVDNNKGRWYSKIVPTIKNIFSKSKKYS